jgi:hypothetical protein
MAFECVRQPWGPNGPKFMVGTAAPTTGYWNQGDFVFNTAPSPSGTFGWVCTTAGDTGVAVWRRVAVNA